jgi:cytochrome c2
MLDFVAPTIKIQQVVLDQMPIDINFTKIPRADRCQTCHLAANRDGFEEEEQPFRSHPRLDLFVGSSSLHPVERFGCTPCHAGRDRAVDFVYATHTPDSPDQREAWEEKFDWKRDHHWEYPMLAESRIEASCLKCHQNVVSVPEAPKLNRGRALIERTGCFACHKMRGYEDRPKVGPPLTRIASKTNPDWMARWIKNPKAFRPSTRMPRLFGLSNHQEEGDAEREDAEMLGIVAYLTSKSTEFETPKYPGGGKPASGERLVKSVGCMGCHALDRFEADPEIMLARARGEAADPIPWERRHGPDLSRVGSKLKPEWLFAWVQNPHDYNPISRMPRLRLTRGEAIDITSYLMTLTDDTPPAQQVAALRPQPEARDRALMAYLTQRATPTDAEARLAQMSEHDKDVLLGERTITRYGCFGCHLIPGFETTPRIGVDLSQEGSKHPDLLFFGFQHIEHAAPAWFYQKLRSPRSFDEGKVALFYDRLRMPKFYFTEEETEAITIVLQGMTKEKMPLESVRRLSARDTAIEAGRRLIQDYNCQGCHIYEGGGGTIRESIARTYIEEGRGEEEARSLAASFSPPIIDGEGDKVQPGWLFSFLKNPEPIRPWLAVRMPTFEFDDDQADTLVHHFAAKAGRTFPFQTFPRSTVRGAELQAAVTMFTPDYFNCWSCHQQGERKPEGPPEGWAPDLTMARQRLNPDWIERWIADPQALMPGTKMPTYYDPEDMAGSAPPDILGGDAEKQIEVLTKYVFTLGHARRGGSSAQP